MAGAQERKGRNHIGDKMMIPIRCFTCGRVIGSLYLKFKERVQKGEDPKDVLDELGVDRYCCRRMILSHVDLVGEVGKY